MMSLPGSLTRREASGRTPSRWSPKSAYRALWEADPTQRPGKQQGGVQEHWPSLAITGLGHRSGTQTTVKCCRSSSNAGLLVHSPHSKRLRHAVPSSPSHTRARTHAHPQPPISATLDSPRPMRTRSLFCRATGINSQNILIQACRTEGGVPSCGTSSASQRVCSAAAGVPSPNTGSTAVFFKRLF